MTLTRRLSGPYVHLAVIACLTLAAYSNSFHVPFQFDDLSRIVNNQFIRGFEYFRDIIKPVEEGTLFRTRYLGFLSLAVNYSINGLHTAGYHIFNLLVHMVNASLLYCLVLLLFRSPAIAGSRLREHAPLVALLSAIVFATHPLQTQAVTYIVQRFASMATMFYLASVVSYMKFRLDNRRRWYAAAFLAAVAGMFTKEVTITIPLMLALIEAVFFEGRPMRRVMILAPLMLTGLIIPAVVVFDKAGGDLSLMVEGVSTGSRLQTETGRASYLYTQFGVLLKYMRLLLLPYGQSLDHYQPLETAPMSPGVAFPLLAHMLIAGASAYAYIRSIKGRIDPCFRAVAFGVAWFYLTSSVESGLIPIKDLIYEHRAYLPGAGLIMSASVLSLVGINRLSSRRTAMGLVILCAISSIVYIPLTIMRNDVWKSPLSLWTDAAHKSPMSSRARANMGYHLMQAGQHGSAVEQFKAAIALEPGMYQPYKWLSISYSALGRDDLADRYEKIAFELTGNSIDYYLERGNRLQEKGMYDQAIGEYEAALEKWHENVAALIDMGIVLMKKGMNEKALSYLIEARRVDPKNIEAYILLAEAFMKMGQPDQARLTYRDALGIEPENSTLLGKFGIFLGMSGENEQALVYLERATGMDPNNSEALLGLGNVLFAAGRLDEAVSSFRKILESDPDNAQAHYNLSVAYSRLGMREKSEASMRRYMDLTGSR